jgi:hypothetical protein
MEKMDKREYNRLYKRKQSVGRFFGTKGDRRDKRESIKIAIPVCYCRTERKKCK